MKKLWGGRFKKRTDALVEEFTTSIGYDYKLARYDVLASIAHAKILGKAKIVSSRESGKIVRGLQSILKQIKSGQFTFDKKSEDIHSNIQQALQKRIGKLAEKLHTARSRNEQVAMDLKMYAQEEIKDLKLQIKELQSALGSLAKKNLKLIIPGFTHLQHAQPVYLSDYLGAYIEMLKRDTGRLDKSSKNIKITMGSGALAGTPIKAGVYSAQGIKPTANPLDVVSDRDFVIDIISALSIIAMHLSRLAEDLVIWSTKEFDFVEIDQAFCTGSSLMPQKKNPDALELIRGYAGRLYGNLVSVLTMMKGLPLSYNRDMQLDKEPLFNSVEIISQELKVLSGLIKTLKFNKAKIKEQLKDESLYATDLVYYLVKKKVPFAQAHTIVGKLVGYAIEYKIGITDLPEKRLRQFSNKFVKKEIIRLFDPRVSVQSKQSIRRGQR